MDTRNSLHEIQAKQYIQYLNSELAIRKDSNLSLEKRCERASLALDNARNSDLYEAIQEKLGNVEISPYEYLFYALVTDDVKTLDSNILASILQYADLPYNLSRNLTIVAAALRFSQSTTPNETKRYHQELIGQLGIDLPYENALRPVYLNLAGIRLANLDCTEESKYRSHSPNLSFCDLRGAEFSNSNFYFLKIRFSDVSNATFANITNRTKRGSDADFNLHGCIAKGARFDAVTASNIDWSGSDFSGAVFNNSQIGVGCFRDSNFTGAVFSNTQLIFSGSYGTYDANFTNADFTTARLIDTNYGVNIFTDARMIAPQSHAELSAEITRVTQAFIQELGGSTPHIEAQLAAFQRIISADVARYIKSLAITEEGKEILLREVMQHDLFHYEYMEATKSLVAEPFPRQANTLVCCGNFSADHFNLDMNPASTAAYNNIYAYGMSVLKKLAEAARHPETFDMWYQQYSELMFAEMQGWLQNDKTQANFPAALIGKDSKTVFDFIMNQVTSHDLEVKLKGLDEKLVAALTLSRLDLMIYGSKETANLSAQDEQKISSDIHQWHPLMTLRYYEKSNCLAPYYFGDNITAYHTIDELIKVFGGDASLAQPVAVSSPSVTKVAATLFNKPVEQGGAAVVEDEPVEETSEIKNFTLGASH